MDHSIFILHSFVILLETRNYAKVGLALWTVVLCLSSQNPSTSVSCVPTEVTRQSWTFPCLRAVSKLFHSVMAIVLCGLPHRAKRCGSMPTMTCMASMCPMCPMSPMTMLLHMATMVRVVTKSWVNMAIVYGRVVVGQNGEISAIIWSRFHKTLLFFIMMKCWGHLFICSYTRI